LAGQEGANEQMKAKEPVKWVGLINNFRSMAHEIVLRKIIYVKSRVNQMRRADDEEN
jgi:hypothetical protein